MIFTYPTRFPRDTNMHVRAHVAARMGVGERNHTSTRGGRGRRGRPHSPRKFTRRMSTSPPKAWSERAFRAALLAPGKKIVYASLLESWLLSAEPTPCRVPEGEHCQICWEELLTEEEEEDPFTNHYSVGTVARTVCKHLFHADCLSKWLKTPSDTCPTCRATLLVKVEEEEDE